jgi:hypothetical protein
MTKFIVITKEAEDEGGRTYFSQRITNLENEDRYYVPLRYTYDNNFYAESAVNHLEMLGLLDPKDHRSNVMNKNNEFLSSVEKVDTKKEIINWGKGK